MSTEGRSVAELIARFLVARGVDRIFGLQGGHIQPIWDHLAQLKVRIVDVRDEGAAVHMAHAHALLSGQVGIAMATAGPGVTNCVTAMTNAHLERVPVLLIGGCPPVPQDDLGPLQGIDHVQILHPVTRWSRTLRVAEQIARDLDKAWAMADGDGNPPGPVYVEIPTNVLRETVPDAVVLEEHLRAKPRRVLQPVTAEVARAATLLRQARRPLVVTGRGARGCGAALTQLLDATGALYLDTQESRGLVDPAHASVVGAMRGRAMLETDLALIVGRKLDYQMGYGSPAVMPQARFVRIADHADELRDNRRGEVEILADAKLALQALAAECATGSRGVDGAWTQALRAEHVKRSAKHAKNLSRAEAGKDGHMHPNRIFGALRQVLKPDAITIADGGDILSFARMGLETRCYLDSGAFGCLGVGTPYAVAAALLNPGRQVVAVTGDGAFGINAMEIDSAKRHGAKCVFIVANNAAWNIERLDQEMNYGGRVVGVLLRHSDYAGMAKALGLHGERVEKPEDMPAALERALKNAPALIDVVTSQTVVSSDAKKGLGTVHDYQALEAWNQAELKRRGK